MAGKYDHINFKPPKSVADAAKTGLELRKKNKGKGGLSAGQAKKQGIGSGVQRAVNLKNRDTMSPATVKRMKAFFDRHEKSKKIDKGETYATDEGYIAWMLWGGNPGRSWANKVVKQMESADKKSKRAMEFITNLKVAKKHVDHIKGGKADKLKPEDFDPKQLAKGKKVEMEHTDDPDISTEITMDHLVESDKYYDHLKEMESKFDKAARAKEFSRQLKFAEEKEEKDYMAFQNICAVHMKAYDLKQVLRKQEDLDDWVEDKISSLADDISELHDYFMHGHGKEHDSKDKKPWEERRKPEGKLTPGQKAKARARAKKNNRSYPNQIDNMWAAQN